MFGDIYNEARADVVIESGVHDLEWAMRLAFEIELGKPGEEAGFVAESGAGVVIGMAALPIGKDHDARLLLADDARDFEPVFPSVLDASVGNVERVAPTDFQNLCRGVGLTGAIFSSAAGAQFSIGQVEDAG